MSIIAPPKLWTPPRRQVVTPASRPARRCRRCNRPRPRWRRPAVDLLAMAGGIRMLDANGYRIINPDGSQQISNADDECGCGCEGDGTQTPPLIPCSECGEGPTTAIARVSFNGVTVPTGTFPTDFGTGGTDVWSLTGTLPAGPHDLPFLGQNELDPITFDPIPIHVICPSDDRIRNWHQTYSFGCVWGKTVAGPTYTASSDTDYPFTLITGDLTDGIEWSCVAITLEMGEGSGVIRAQLFVMIGFELTPGGVSAGTINQLEPITLVEAGFTYEGSPCEVDIEDAANTAGDGTVDLVMI